MIITFLLSKNNHFTVKVLSLSSHTMRMSYQWSSAAYQAPSGSGSGKPKSVQGCASKSSWWRWEHTNPPQSQLEQPEGKDEAGSEENVVVRQIASPQTWLENLFFVVTVPGLWEVGCSLCPSGHPPPASAESCPEVSIKTINKEKQKDSEIWK